MSRLLIAVVAVACVVAVPSRILPVGDKAPIVTEELIAHINSRQTTWTAGRNDKFDGMSIAEAKVYMGTILGGRLPPALAVDSTVKAPSEFDARTAWPGCPSIPMVRDQSACGSCWAFGSTEAFNDRLCIATNNTIILSPADVLSCCAFTCGDGCNGGMPPNAWHYFVSHGVVPVSCFDYPFAPCAHHVVSPDYPACPSGEYDTPKCNKTCADGSDFNQDKIKAKSTFSINGEENIMKEISTNGPVTAAFTVYNDFITYKKGVYQHVSGEELGGHAVEIVGYGVEDGHKYWLVKNSWNPSWGDGGFFKILRGSDECGIESEIVAGHAA